MWLELIKWSFGGEGKKQNFSMDKMNFMIIGLSLKLTGLNFFCNNGREWGRGEEFGIFRSKKNFFESF
ncbi:MAG: hypothetical protein DRI99_04740 [Candidatus Aminicenantes bacterium]|nr:MAG: hypothetical protein DRJ11_06460 [Candidatus Aminicenantes bacterium]RLE03627.1 MAG: hypothetical protein DRI99_04740 [Candidatus Aminicenantes bacterium]